VRHQRRQCIKNFFIVAPGDNILSDLPNNLRRHHERHFHGRADMWPAAALVFQRALAGNTQLTRAKSRTSEEVGG
jgi:hypothetical protein